MNSNNLFILKKKKNWSILALLHTITNLNNSLLNNNKIKL